ncbi:SAICAR synthase-like protein [Ceraceosorus guamensis]|uniref:Kinase n=1 Tax=Ceraceosorus guamensis TaxID=1522189 RepID=A0A316W7T8_9BASI|nr:SAICAR synthase-like protein [Ceraceosorus guamensis]PWN45980.1 SAICAR synthase-like protein [Ceraceosorus guamensis]
MSVPAPETDSKLLEGQVAGHGGVQLSPDGSTVIKPSVASELHFYTQLQAASQGTGAYSSASQLRDDLARLSAWTPAFRGEVLDESRDSTQQEATKQKALIQLENLTHGFAKPCVLDVKLGTQLWDESDASEEKRARMNKTALETTSAETGIRFTGCRIWDSSASAWFELPKAFGKSIDASLLPLGFSSYFSDPLDSDEARLSQVASRAGFKLPEGGHLPRLPPKIVAYLLQHSLAALNEFRALFANIELRMRGGSLLFIYEGHLPSLETAIEAHDTGSKVLSVKLIDFAHTRLTPGEGPDLGVLRGVDTTIAIIDRLLKDVKAGRATQDHA